jgi:type II secretion system protein G
MTANYKRGFTLIELLVVIAIIGILSSVVLASLNSARQKGRDARRVSDIKQLQLALELFYDANQSYPTSTGLTGLSTAGYIAAVPVDPNGNAYTYSALDNADAACNTSCPNYVLKAVLEQADHSVFDGDVDGTINSVACDDAAGTLGYCVQP